MSRRSFSPLGRPVSVWLLVTAGAAASWACTGASVRPLASGAVWHGTFEDLFVAVASAALVASACWLWFVTTLTIADLARGRESSGGGLTRRLVLMACGVAVVAGVSTPALAGSSDQVLEGLPLPDRAVSGAVTRQDPEPGPVTAPTPAARPAPPSAHKHHERHGRHEPITVRPGDSLWSIALADLGPHAGLREIDERWRALYAINRDAIGDDPDLITPGQHLRLLPVTDLDLDSDR